MAACKRLEESGFEVVYLRPESDGRISPEALAEAVDEQTVLVSIMLVNNEIGAVNPIAKLSAAAKSVNPELVFHTDAVQGFCKIPFSTSGLGVDFVTVTAHKIGGPKGIGALWIKKGARVIARNLGGEQERRLRGGTEALPLIAAFGEAARESAQEQPEYAKRMSMLHEHLCAALSGEPGILINSPEGALDSIVNLSVLGARSEIMLHFLEERGIYVSSGSACARGKKSHVLTALGLARERTDSALRISFGRENTTEDVDTLAAALLEARERFSKK